MIKSKTEDAFSTPHFYRYPILVRPMERKRGPIIKAQVFLRVTLVEVAVYDFREKQRQSVYMQGNANLGAAGGNKIPGFAMLIQSTNHNFC